MQAALSGHSFGWLVALFLLLVTAESLAAPIDAFIDEAKDNGPVFARWGCCGKPKTSDSLPNSPARAPPSGAHNRTPTPNSPPRSESSTEGPRVFGVEPASPSSDGHWVRYGPIYPYYLQPSDSKRPTVAPHSDHDTGGWRSVFGPSGAARQPYTKIITDDGGKRRVSYVPAKAMPLHLGSNPKSAGAGPSGTTASPGHSRPGSGSNSSGSTPRSGSPARDPSKGKAPMSGKQH